MNLKLASLNLCLGLSKKKDDVANIVRENKISILCMQEIELEPGTNPSMLTIKNYRLEVETNSVKKRVGVYVMNGIKSIRRNDLKGVDSNLLNLDIVDCFCFFLFCF